MALQVGETAPAFELRATHNGEVKTVSLSGLLEGQRALVLITSALDFTGG